MRQVVGFNVESRTESNAESKHIVLVTCQRWPNLSRGDAALADELMVRGHHVVARPWNDAPLVEFTSADLIVLRSNWDFHHDPAGFERWLDAVEASPAEVRNQPDLVRSFLDKTYISDLAALGFRTPETLVADELDPTIVGAWADGFGFDRIVLKPAWGASGHEVQLVDRSDLAEVGAAWRNNPDRRSMLVQEFIPGVSDGEYALVFFAGNFSHALIRQPTNGDFRVNSKYGGTMSHVENVDPSLIEFGGKVEAAFPWPATYARIDVVVDGDDYVLMEVEVNEPALGLNLAPGSAARFADALRA